MGYVPGKGIGKHGTGIAEPINESVHKGRRGLGFFLDGLEKEDVEWELEKVCIITLFYQHRDGEMMRGWVSCSAFFYSFFFYRS